MSDTTDTNDTKAEVKSARREYTLKNPIIDGGEQKPAGAKVRRNPDQAKNVQD